MKVQNGEEGRCHFLLSLPFTTPKALAETISAVCPLPLFLSVNLGVVFQVSCTCFLISNLTGEKKHCALLKCLRANLLKWAPKVVLVKLWRKNLSTGRGGETRLVLRFGSFLRSGVKDPHFSLDTENTVFLPGCICPFPEEEMSLLTFH